MEPVAAHGPKIEEEEQEPEPPEPFEYIDDWGPEVCIWNRIVFRGNLFVDTSQMFYGMWSHFFPFVLNPYWPKRY